MGLDQYAWAVKPLSDNVELSDFDLPPSEEVEKVEIAYWRKHPNLQGWVESLWIKKRAEAGEPVEPEADGWFAGEVVFNCIPVRLTRHDLANLEEAVRGEELPHTSGFFFGESLPEDKADDLRFIKNAHKYLDDGWSIYYYSWW